MLPESSPTILLVDDEEIILNSIKALLAIEDNYSLLVYTSPLRALDDVSGKNGKNEKIGDIDLVISDYLMPEMDGITFLAEIKKTLPLVPRILLTGYADKENAIKAINSVGLYQYLEKPWSNDDLQMIIRNAVEKMSLLRQLQNKIQETEKAHIELGEIQKDILRVFA